MIDISQDLELENLGPNFTWAGGTYLYQSRKCYSLSLYSYSSYCSIDNSISIALENYRLSIVGTRRFHPDLAMLRDWVQYIRFILVLWDGSWYQISTGVDQSLSEFSITFEALIEPVIRWKGNITDRELLSKSDYQSVSIGNQLILVSFARHLQALSWNNHGSSPQSMSPFQVKQDHCWSTMHHMTRSHDELWRQQSHNLDVNDLRVWDLTDWSMPSWTHFICTQKLAESTIIFFMSNASDHGYQVMAPKIAVSIIAHMERMLASKSGGSPLCCSGNSVIMTPLAIPKAPSWLQEWALLSSIPCDLYLQAWQAEVTMRLSSSENISNEIMTMNDEKSLDNTILEQDGSQGPFDKKAFLSTFTREEDRAIMRKVDRRFLLLIGTMYFIKNVSLVLPLAMSTNEVPANFISI